jgi:hypothetical protein
MPTGALSSTVDLSQPAPLRTKRGRCPVGRKRRGGKHAAATTVEATPRSPLHPIGVHQLPAHFRQIATSGEMWNSSWFIDTIGVGEANSNGV